MDLDAFDFVLPEQLIALRPVEPKDEARLLVIYRSGRFVDAHVKDLPSFLNSGDALVFNNTRVLPAALKGVRPGGDGVRQDVSVQVNLVEQLDASAWKALARPGRRLRVGDKIVFSNLLEAEVRARFDGGAIELKFNHSGETLREVIAEQGDMPLPPYIAQRRPAEPRDRQDYQTRFASGEANSVAAPTAGLHFTERLIEALDAAGIDREFVTLDVGLGTFSPLTNEQISNKQLHQERREVSTQTARALNDVRSKGQRVVAVGTTAFRTLESSLSTHGSFTATNGSTDIFIQPGDTIKSVDGLMTNFHLPRSSLFMLVCALMGTQIMQAAYRHAIDKAYRFYSYGDACLLLPED